MWFTYKFSVYVTFRCDICTQDCVFTQLSILPHLWKDFYNSGVLLLCVHTYNTLSIVAGRWLILQVVNRLLFLLACLTKLNLKLLVCNIERLRTLVSVRRFLMSCLWTPQKMKVYAIYIAFPHALVPILISSVSK